MLGENVWILKALESGRPVGRLMDFLCSEVFLAPSTSETWESATAKPGLFCWVFPDLPWPFLSFLALRNGMGVGTLSSCAALRLDFSHRQIQLLSRCRQINFLGNDFWMFVMYELGT